MSKIWIEIDLTVEVKEKGTTILTIKPPYDVTDPETIIEAARKTIREKLASILSDKDVMQLDNIKPSYRIIKFYLDDGTGNPNLEEPITISEIEDPKDNE